MRHAPTSSTTPTAAGQVMRGSSWEGSESEARRASGTSASTRSAAESGGRMRPPGVPRAASTQPTTRPSSTSPLAIEPVMLVLNATSASATAIASSAVESAQVVGDAVITALRARCGSSDALIGRT